MSVTIYSSFMKWYIYCFVYLILVFAFFFTMMIGKKSLELPFFFFLSTVIIIFISSSLFAGVIKFYSDTIITEKGLGKSQQNDLPNILWQDVTKIYSIFIIPVFFVDSIGHRVPILIPKKIMLKEPQKVKKNINLLKKAYPDLINNVNVKFLFDHFT